MLLNFKKSFFVICVIAFFFIAGCGSETDNASGDESNSNGSDGEENVNLVFATISGESIVRWEEEIAAFEEENPNVTVELRDYDDDYYNQNAVRLFNSDDKPDVAWFWANGFYHDIVDSGALLPLDELYESEGWNDVLTEQTLESYTSSDGHKYAAPESIVLNPIIFYNKKAFEEAGLEEPENFEEFLKMGDPLRDAGYIPWTSGMANPSQATALLDIAIKRTVSPEHYQRLLSKEDMDYTHPDIVDAFRLMQEMGSNLMPEGGVAGIQADEARAIFAQEQAAMYSDASVNAGPGMLGSELPEDFELGMFFYPEFREDAGKTIGYYDGQAIMAINDTGKEEWAKKFISFVMSKERQKVTGENSSNFPSRTDLSEEEILEVYSEVEAEMYKEMQEEGTHIIFNTVMPGAYRPAAVPLIQGLIMGQYTPEEFAEEFNSMVEEVHE